MIAYFDINVYDAIRRRKVITDAELEILKALVKLGELTILLSIPLIEELSLLLNSDAEAHSTPRKY